MPLINPVIIGGKVVGAYVDETYAVQGQGTTTLTELLQYILNIVNGGGFTPVANNGLNVDAGVTQLGGTLIEDTTVTNPDKLFKVGRDVSASDKSLITQDSISKLVSVHNENATNYSYLAASPTGFGVNVTNKNNDTLSALDLREDEASYNIGNSDTGDIYSGLLLFTDQAALYGVRTYANNAAALADATLRFGGLYRITGDQVLRIKML